MKLGEMFLAVACFLFGAIGGTASLMLPAQPQQTEAEWVEHFATDLNGTIPTERLWDRTQPDLITDTHAIEFDFGPKWAEAIGQALYYAELTGKKPGIVLLLRPDNNRFGYRCQTICAKYGIRLWIKRIQ